MTQRQEHEVSDPGQLYFEPSGNVYNPQIQRELSLIGPQGILGPPSGFGNGGFSSPGGHGGSAGGPSNLAGALSDLTVVGRAIGSVELLNFPGAFFPIGGSEFGINVPIPLLGNLLCLIDCGSSNGDQPIRPPHETSSTHLIFGLKLINGQRSVVRVSDSEYPPPAPLYYGDDSAYSLAAEAQFWMDLSNEIAFYFHQTGDSVPRNLKEEMIMKEIKDNPRLGSPTKTKMKDPYFPAEEGWQKYVFRHDGVEIHYDYNRFTDRFTDFKFHRPEDD